MDGLTDSDIKPVNKKARADELPVFETKCRKLYHEEVHL